jgi:hypothetical protein
VTSPDPNVDPEQQPEPVVDEQLLPLEEAFYALVLAALTVWLAKAAGRVVNRTAKTLDPSALLALAPQWREQVEPLIRWLKAHVAPVGWARVGTDLPDRAGDVGSFPSTNAHVIAQLAQVGNYLVRIPDEVFDQVVAVIVDGNDAGENFEEIAERIDGVLSATGSENWPNRARVISVTEVNGTANAGWYASALHLEEVLGISLDKEWLQSHDNRVRPEHRTNQTVPLRDPFIIGGEPLLRPGDKAGSAWNVINCRCSARTKERRR